METIDDIRKLYGNPNAGMPDGPVHPINRSFRSPDAACRLAALVVFILGGFVTILGVWTLVLPISVIGLAILAFAAALYFRACCDARRARKNGLLL